MVIVDPPAGVDERSTRPSPARRHAHEQQERGGVLPAHQRARPAPRRPDRDVRAVGCDRRRDRAHRRDARRLEGAGRARRDRSAGVVALAIPLTDLEIGRLNPLGVNCLRDSPGAGHTVWGARTRAGTDRLASEWKYLPVRRTALFLEESLYRGTQWVVFEPNDEPLWAQIRLNVGAFMNNLFRQGAFAGHDAARGVLRQVRRRDDDAGRRQPRDRQHRGRLRAAQAGRVRRHPAAADGRPDRERMMAQFTVNAAAVRPVQELQVPRQVGRPLRRRHQQGGRAQAHDRGRRAPRGRRPVVEPQVAGPHEVRGDHARARRHARHRVRGVGEQGLELRLRPRRGGLAQGLPQGRDHRRLQRGRPARALVQGLPRLGLGVPGAARPRRERERRRDPAHQARERGLGARLRGAGAQRAVFSEP